MLQATVIFVGKNAKFTWIVFTTQDFDRSGVTSEVNVKINGGFSMYSRMTSLADKAKTFLWKKATSSPFKINHKNIAPC